MRRVLRQLGSRVTSCAAAPRHQLEDALPAAAAQQQKHAAARWRMLSSYASRPGAGAGAPRRVPQRPRPGSGGGEAGGAAAAGGAAGGGGPGQSLMEMSREVPGGGKPLRSWERWYWGAGVGGVSAFLFWRLKPETVTQEQIESELRAKAALEVARKDHLRGVLAAQRAGGFIAEGDDPLDGLSPRQIEELMAREGIDPRDPLEGMSPEEIDEYAARQAAAEAALAASRLGSGGDGGGGSGSSASGSDGS
ncbi:MAG: hypothetical protein J3K34DRAFT_517837 [Monoraphidium minutum]|nr:MAG: hypothetical protein J3K34DRAFT_517837 [Monoraphidium minutum]